MRGLGVALAHGDARERGAVLPLDLLEVEPAPINELDPLHLRLQPLVELVPRGLPRLLRDADDALRLRLSKDAELVQASRKEGMLVESPGRPLKVKERVREGRAVAIGILATQVLEAPVTVRVGVPEHVHWADPRVEVDVDAIDIAAVGVGRDGAVKRRDPPIGVRLPVHTKDDVVVADPVDDRFSLGFDSGLPLGELRSLERQEHRLEPEDATVEPIDSALLARLGAADDPPEIVDPGAVDEAAEDLLVVDDFRCLAWGRLTVKRAPGRPRHGRWMSRTASAGSSSGVAGASSRAFARLTPFSRNSSGAST